MFGRKKDEPPGAAKPQTPAADAAAKSDNGDDISAPPLKPFSSRGSHTPAKPPSPASFHPDVPRRSAPDIPGISNIPARRSPAGLASDSDNAKRLLIARDISISGEVTSCDRLVVEGRAEVALPNARVIEVTPSGLFKGSADVEEADISGRFEGRLVARDRLIVRSGGRISGTIRYGRIVIESGGEISGDMQTLDAVTASGGDADDDQAGAAEDGTDAPGQQPANPKKRRGGARAAAKK